MCIFLRRCSLVSVRLALQGLRADPVPHHLLQHQFVTMLATTRIGETVLGILRAMILGIGTIQMAEKMGMSGMTPVAIAPVVADMVMTWIRMASQGGQVVGALLGPAVVAEALVASVGVQTDPG